MVSSLGQAARARAEREDWATRTRSGGGVLRHAVIGTDAMRDHRYKRLAKAAVAGMKRQEGTRESRTEAEATCGGRRRGPKRDLASFDAGDGRDNGERGGGEHARVQPLWWWW